MTKIMVTGASGFVGRHLIDLMLRRGDSIIALGGAKTNKSEDASKKSPSFLVIDLMNRSDLSLVDFLEVDYVVHLAGLAAVGPSFDNPMQYIETNVGIEINLFEEALRQKAFPKFLIVSSGSVYDPASSMPITEDSPILPNSPYSLSKIGQEQAAKYYSTRGFECVIARPFNHIGPGQGPGFIVSDLSSQIKSKSTSSISVGNLETKRDYTDVRDIARAYRMLLESGKSGETYNVCSGSSVSGRTVLDKLLHISGTTKEVIIDRSKLRPTDVVDIYGSHDKLTRHTGWEPMISLDRTLEDVMASIRA